MVIVTDMEAGLEHLSRSTVRASDVLLVVAEPYYKSLATANQVKTLATELGIPKTYAVANKVRTPTDAQAIQAFCEKHDLPVLATIPYDAKMVEASQIPQAPLDLDPDTPGVRALAELAAKLASIG